MQICSNCNAVNEDGIATCLRCGEELQPRSWWRKILDFFTPEEAAPPPAVDTAVGEQQRLRLYEEWLNYGLGQDGFVMFSSEQGCTVHFIFGNDFLRCDIITMDWEEIFGAPLPSSIAELLTREGFKEPVDWRQPNYQQQIDHLDVTKAAELAEWTFSEVFGVDRNFMVTVNLSHFE